MESFMRGVMPEGGMEAGEPFCAPVSHFPRLPRGLWLCGGASGERRVAVATDMGVMTDAVMQAISGCDLVVFGVEP